MLTHLRWDCLKSARKGLRVKVQDLFSFSSATKARVYADEGYRHTIRRIDNSTMKALILASPKAKTATE